MKFKLVITCLLVSLCSFLAADQEGFLLPKETSCYQRSVQSIAYQVRGELTVVSLNLDDQTIWNISVYPSEEYILSEVEDKMAVGAKVFLYPNIKHHTYAIFAKKGEEDLGYVIGMAKETKERLPKIKEIKKIVLSKGWIFANKCAYQVVLSDGSEWQLDESRYYWTDSPAYWKVGHTVIPSRNLKDEFMLINTDAPCVVDCSVLGNYTGEWDTRLFPYFPHEKIHLVKSPL